MADRTIHIYGASGSGTTTLAKRLFPALLLIGEMS